VRLVCPAAGCGTVTASHEVDLVPGVGDQEVQQARPAAGAGRETQPQDQVAAGGVSAAGEHDRERAVVIPPRRCAGLRLALAGELPDLDPAGGPDRRGQPTRLGHNTHSGRQRCCSLRRGDILGKLRVLVKCPGARRGFRAEERFPTCGPWCVSGRGRGCGCSPTRSPCGARPRGGRKRRGTGAGRRPPRPRPA
jgi:hypothetical protein